MRIAAWLLLAANVVMAAYLAWGVPAQRGMLDVRGLEMNADRIKPLRDASPRAETVSEACLEWGPLATTELARARDELAKYGIEGAQIREAPRTAVWWVYIPPAKSREEAERRVRELEGLGVQEARVVTEDGWRNAVSLGIFRSEEMAAAHQSRLREIKVRNAVIVQRSDLLKFSTIVLVAPAPQTAARLVELAAGYAGSDIKAAACTPGKG